MNINWNRIKYVKGILPYLHKIRVFLTFLVTYVQLSQMRHHVKRGAPERKFIVINLIEHFGDIVACEPVSRYVRRRYPDAYIIWTVKKSYRELVLHNPAIDEVFVLNCLSEWIYLATTGLFDEIIDLHPQNRECPVCRKPLLKSSGNTDITVENYYNYDCLLAAYCQSAGIPAIEDQPQMYIPREVIQRVDLLRLPERYVVVHCSSNEQCRDWSQEKWQQLAQKIIGDFGLHVVEIGLQSVLDFQSDHYISQCSTLSLLETAEIIRRADLFIGIDSGPAHMANAAGTFGIILLGEYRIFKHYMPYSGGYKSGENASIIHAKGLAADISVSEVYELVKSELTHG